MMDSVIHLLNNWGQVLFHSFSFHCSFALHWSHNDYFEIETDCKRSKTELEHTKVKSTKLGCKHVTNKIALATFISFASPLERTLGPLTLWNSSKLMSSEPKEYASVWYNFITRKGAICFFSIFTKLNQKFCRIFTLATFESEKVKMAIAIASSFPFFSFLAIFLVFASNFILWES